MKNKMVQLCMYHKSRKGPVISHDATTRYLEFLENYPSLINRVPLVYVASYLGVTQQSLSRVRKNILIQALDANGQPNCFGKAEHAPLYFDWEMIVCMKN